MRPSPTRPTHRLAAATTAVLLVAAVVLSGPGAAAQNVESLRARAERIADELAALEHRASKLDEQYLQLSEELEQLESERSAKQAEVSAAQRSVDEARGQAKGYLIEAYIGAGSKDLLSLGSTDVNAAVNQRALLEIVRGDTELMADAMDVSRQDLEVSVDALEQSERELGERRKQQQALAGQIESAVSEHRQLLSGANAQLRAAIDAERERREAAEQAAAERQQAAEQARQQRAAAARTETASSERGRAGRSRTPAPAQRPAPQRPAPAPDSPPIPVSAPNGRAAAAIAAARSQLGTPYRWAGSSPGGFDCSGLMLWSWAQAGVSLPRTSRAQYAGTQRISASQLQPGDLVFYGSPVHHVGMYVGGGQMIHSPRTGDVVNISPIQRGFGNPSGYGRIG